MPIFMGAYFLWVLIIPVCVYTYVASVEVCCREYPVPHLKPALQGFMTKHRLIAVHLEHTYLHPLSNFCLKGTKFVATFHCGPL